MSKAFSFLRRFWPRRLLGQTILLVLIALFAAQIIGALIIRSETRSFNYGYEIRYLAERTASMHALFRESRQESYGRIAEAVSNKPIQVWVSPTPAVPNTPDFQDIAYTDLIRERLVERYPELDVSDLRVAREGGDAAETNFSPRGPFAERLRASGVAPERAAYAEAFVSLPLGDSEWLNVAFHDRPVRRLVRAEAWAAALVAAAAISLIVFFALRRITSSLGRLSDAAVRMGRGEKVENLDEAGPADVRETIRAFNEMQENLRRFIDDRTRMLAAISHDLRTPITSLRLRAELVDDEETRDKMIATLDDMQRMTEATLAFAREDANKEDTRVVDLEALIGAIADDMSDMGRAVTIAVSEPVKYPCRPTALRRALVNLIENACTYGERANVRLLPEGEAVIVQIDDDGAGIPSDKLRHVFEPFVTLDPARNRESGGSGLGLAIARDIIRRHGGEIDLSNRQEGGLRVTITLPFAKA